MPAGSAAAIAIELIAGGGRRETPVALGVSVLVLPSSPPPRETQAKRRVRDDALDPNRQKSGESALQANFAFANSRILERGTVVRSP